MCFVHGRTESLNIIFNVLAMAQAISRHAFTVEAPVLSKDSPCEICGGQTGIGTGVSPSNSVFLCQHHSTNDRYSSSSNSKNLPSKQCSFGNQEALDTEVLSFPLPPF